MSKTIAEHQVSSPLESFKESLKPAVLLYRSTSRAATSPLRMLPDFVIIGAQKGGTTSLYSYLITHPSIGGAARKELNFFDQNYYKGIAWYRSQFPTTMRKYYVEHMQKLPFITGEASPNYFPHPHAAKRLAKLLPQVKLIALLRNPVDRAYSQYRHNISRGLDTLSFAEAIAREEERTKEEREKVEGNEHIFNHTYQRYNYIARGLYADQLEQWYGYFPKEQFLLLTSDDFYKDPNALVKEALHFLGIPEAQLERFDSSPRQENKSGEAKSKLDPEIRQQLVEYYRPYNQRLYELMGSDLGWDR